MYRTTAATGGSHPQHILLLETHIFPAKCQLGEAIKVSRGLAAAPVGSEFHMNLFSFHSSISQPLGMSHWGPHLPSPVSQVSAAPPPARFSSSARVPGCTWGPIGCPQGCPPDLEGLHRCSSSLEFTSAPCQSCSPQGGTRGAPIQLDRQGQGSVRDQPWTPEIQPRHPGLHSNSLLSLLEFFQSLQGCSQQSKNPRTHNIPTGLCQNLTCHATYQYRSSYGFVKNDVLGCDASDTFVTQ